ncbi:hypothetical protein [Methanogenium sp. MK-MG]|uniref:hypothetical protein n=1 Tax=Methanogenium sp. MK-MG TaxID=2599926 RepID=UPI0013ED0D46|nr:hypothetical protein [Methanogenium sp. MK-MG]KAF1077205.1 hypothetical protein MKMG_01331 [Methanogenium sp. MK-MG]
MGNNKISLLVLSLLFLGIIVSTSCGCIETDSKSEQVGDTDLGVAVVEHEYVFGFMESKYDARIWVMGADVVDVQGITESELEGYLDQYVRANSPPKTVVYTPVSTELSSLEVIGDVSGLDTDGEGVAVDTIRFTVGLAAGGSPVNFSSAQMVFSTRDGVEILKQSSPITSETTTAGHWTIADGAFDDLLLEGNDTFTLCVMPTTALPANQQFNLEIRPSVGGSFALIRTVPAKIHEVNILN